MKVRITMSVSNRDKDSLARAIDSSIERIVAPMVIEFQADDKNMDAWLSEQRKVDFAKKYEEQFPKLSCKVEEILISK